MATNDIKLHIDTPFGAAGTLTYQVAASATLINPGEPVAVTALGSPAVAPMATNKPVVATDFLVGIAMSVSTNTASAAGTVEVMPLMPGQVWRIKPNVAATWNTQAKYDALVGARVLIDLTSSSYTILAADGATSGCVIQELDISKYPTQVAFSFREGCNYLV